MGGNALELVYDRLNRFPSKPSKTERNPIGPCRRCNPLKKGHVIKGGYISSEPYPLWIRSGEIGLDDVQWGGEGVGFRCAKGMGPEHAMQQ